MTTLTPFSVVGKRVVVVGAARSGVAAAELLVRRGAKVTLTDTRQGIDEENRLRDGGVRLELGRHVPETLTSADLIVLSPGVPPRQPVIEQARRAGVPVIGELELASRWLRGRIVAITGTKGKSTTTTLTGRMLEEGGHRVLVGGNIGVALSAQVDASTDDTIHVVEASSFQLESTDTFKPWIAVLLNFSPDHLDRHADAVEYAAAKSRIFANQDTDDWAVLNADDRASRDIARDGRAQRLLFAMEADLSDGIVIAGDSIVRRTAHLEQVLVPVS
jgi:UDP-N-acetylmuramoylalanine--D-glutamate ligase